MAHVPLLGHFMHESCEDCPPVLTNKMSGWKRVAAGRTMASQTMAMAASPEPPGRGMLMVAPAPSPDPMLVALPGVDRGDGATVCEHLQHHSTTAHGLGCRVPAHGGNTSSQQQANRPKKQAEH